MLAAWRDRRAREEGAGQAGRFADFSVAGTGFLCAVWRGGRQSRLGMVCLFACGLARQAGSVRQALVTQSSRKLSILTIPISVGQLAVSGPFQNELREFNYLKLFGGVRKGGLVRKAHVSNFVLRQQLSQAGGLCSGLSRHTSSYMCFATKAEAGLCVCVCVCATFQSQHTSM